MAAKETVLEDGASIYQKREKKSEKQKWGEMNSKEKWGYFNQYYRNKLIILIVGVVAGVWLLYTIFGPSVENVLYIAVINDYWEDEAQTELQDNLREYLQIESKWKQVAIDDTYFFNDDSSGEAYNYVQKLAAFIFAGDIDLIISDEEQFSVYATQDYFLNLKEVLPADLYAQVEDYLVYFSSESSPEALPVGIRLGESKVFQSMKGYQQDPIVGIMGNSEYQENSIAAIRYFFAN